MIPENRRKRSGNLFSLSMEHRQIYAENILFEWKNSPSVHQISIKNGSRSNIAQDRMVVFSIWNLFVLQTNFGNDWICGKMWNIFQMKFLFRAWETAKQSNITDTLIIG